MKRNRSRNAYAARLRTRRILMYSAIAAAAAVIFFLYPSRPSPQAGLVRPAVGGDRLAPDFRLPKLGGGEAGISTYLGKVVVLDFWATWCAPCKAEIPDFIELQDRYGKEGLQIVGVALDTRDAVDKFAPAMKMNYPVLYGNENVSALYGGISGLPTTFIIDRQGNIITSFEGFQSKSVFESEIRKLL